MASGKNARQKQLDEQAKASQTQYNLAIGKLAEPTEHQKAVDAENTAVLNYRGPAEGTPGVSWAGGPLAMYNKHANEENRGAYTMGKQYANANLLAGQETQERAREAEASSLDLQNQVNARRAEARGLQGDQLTYGRLGNVAGVTGQMYGQQQQVANQFAAQPGFWSNFLFAGLNAAGSAAGAFASDIILKEDIK